MRSLRSVLGMTNKLCIHRYKRSFSGVLIFFWDTLFTFDVCILLFQVLLTGLSRRNDEGWNLIYCLAVLNIIGQSFLNLFHDFKLRMAADQVNKLTVDKFIFNRRHKRFMQRQWEDLQVGDIIKIKNGQQLPADCLILDIKGGGNNNAAEQLCYIKGGPSVVNGESETKKSCQNTQNKTGSRLSDSKFVQLLSGQIKWEYNSKGKYHGSLKLNENPAAFEFKGEHIVTRGSSLYMTEQIICMVLNIGDECYGSVMRERQIRAPSIFNWLLKFREIKYQKYYYGEMVFNVRVLQTFALLFTFASWIMVLFGDLILSSSPLGNFKRTFLEMEVGGNISF
jgi:magnesium-transporting ATPase (P-type)